MLGLNLDKRKVILPAVSLSIILMLSGCGTGGGNGNGNTGGNGNSPSDPSTSNPTSTGTPTPTPTPTEDVPDEHGDHTDITEDQQASAAAYTESFVNTLVNKDLSTEAWRAAVIPNLYSDEMKELYSTLDPYSIPFCTAVEDVEIGAINTFSVVYKVQFVDTLSFMAVEVEDVSANFDGSAYQVVKMDTKMKDDGGC